MIRKNLWVLQDVYERKEYSKINLYVPLLTDNFEFYVNFMSTNDTVVQNAFFPGPTG